PGEELGGEARGRSHLVGRVQIQFGERFGDTVPISVATLPPGGMLLRSRGGPIADVFPGRLPAGLFGHSEFLRFPLRTYYLDSVSCIDDPFDVALGAVNVRTGEVIGELPHGGRPPRGGMRGGADDVIASNGNHFSYRYRIPADPSRERATFEYTNRAQGGTFLMTGLAWVSFTHSRTRPVSASGCDTVTFTG